MPFKKRKQFPDLNKFSKENSNFIFIEENFIEAVTHKKFLKKELEDFLSHYKNYKRDHHFSKVSTDHLKHFNLFKRFESSSDLNKMPLTTKSTIRENELDFDNEYTKNIDRWHNRTSGTSSTPLDIYYSNEFYLSFFYLTLVKTAVRAGIRELGERPFFSTFLTDNDNYQNSIFPYADNSLGPHLIVKFKNDDQKIIEVVDFLNKSDPEIISSKPNILSNIMENSKRLGLSIAFSPKLIVSSGAMLSEKLRLDLEEYFKTQVTSSYNITELGHVGSECAHKYMHVDSSNIFVECLNEKDEEVEDGLEGELVFSSLANSAMPFLRYKTGDKGIISHEQCSCGQRGPRIVALKGRTVIQFLTKEGKKISPTQWMHIFTKFPELENYQMTQKSYEIFEIKAEFKDSVKLEEVDVLISQLRDYFMSSLPENAHLVFSITKFDKQDKFSRFRCEII